jgi:molecular chaperone GrpE
MTNTDDRPELEDKLSELEILRQSLEETKAKEKDYYDQLLRLTAEFQNYRKRSETRISDSRLQGKGDVLIPVINLCDALIQAEIASQKTTEVESLKKGLSLLKAQFEKFLADQGLISIKSIGEKLDPLKHEAIVQVERADVDEGIIVDEIQRGYSLNGIIVRPSRVSVSKKPTDHATIEVKEETQHG